MYDNRKQDFIFSSRKVVYEWDSTKKKFRLQKDNLFTYIKSEFWDSKLFCII